MTLILGKSQSMPCLGHTFPFHMYDSCINTNFTLSLSRQLPACEPLFKFVGNTFIFRCSVFLPRRWLSRALHGVLSPYKSPCGSSSHWCALLLDNWSSLSSFCASAMCTTRHRGIRWQHRKLSSPEVTRLYTFPQEMWSGFTNHLNRAGYTVNI